MIRVTVSGPGGTFGLEMYYIQKLLEDMGWSVAVQDDHALDEEEVEKSEAYRKVRVGGHPMGNKAVLQADHQPWGG